jgi:hypothetical protein
MTEDKKDLVHVVLEFNEKTAALAETLWWSYQHEYCHNYTSLEKATNMNRNELKTLLEPFKKLGFIYTAHGLMTEDGEVAGSGFQVNGIEAYQLLELALYRYNYNDRPFGQAEDYVPVILNVAGYTYRLEKKLKQ